MLKKKVFSLKTMDRRLWRRKADGLPVLIFSNSTSFDPILTRINVIQPSS